MAMQAVRKDLMSMKVTELKRTELEACGEAKTGNKACAWVRDCGDGRVASAPAARCDCARTLAGGCGGESERIWRTADSLGYNQSSFQTVINDLFKPL